MVFWMLLVTFKGLKDVFVDKHGQFFLFSI